MRCRTEMAIVALGMLLLRTNVVRLESGERAVVMLPSDIIGTDTKPIERQQKRRVLAAIRHVVTDRPEWPTICLSSDDICCSCNLFLVV